MEFSWNYSETMRNFATSSCFLNRVSNEDARVSKAFNVMVKFDVNNGECEVPSFIADRVPSYVPLTADDAVTVVIPLYTSEQVRTCSGAETILKHFSRYNFSRLNKVVTPKGETYYGNSGIILDDNFNPLILTTVKIVYDFTGRRPTMTRCGYKVYMHPRVFTDDTKLLNKSLAKKGIAYYLSNYAVNQWGVAPIEYKVEIDDCSKFIVKAQSPKVASFTNEEVTTLLQENIDEVLRQVANDTRR